MQGDEGINLPKLHLVKKESAHLNMCLISNLYPFHYPTLREVQANYLIPEFILLSIFLVLKYIFTKYITGHIY